MIKCSFKKYAKAMGFQFYNKKFFLSWLLYECYTAFTASGMYLYDAFYNNCSIL